MFKLAPALIAAASAIALSVGAAQAQDAVQYQVTPGVLEQALTQLPPPRYIVRATTLYANDETGPDWPGSDEVYAVFTLRTPDRLGGDSFYARTAVFGDFDTGETKRFRADQNCLTSVVRNSSAGGAARTWDCHPNGDRINLTFTVQLFEEDSGEDDLIGERTVSWTPAELDGASLAVGQKLPESIRLGGYTLTWEVERVS